MSATDRAWRRWGRTDPYYGVLSDERFRISNIVSAKTEFFASGESYIDRRIAFLSDVLGLQKRKRVLDFGCGVGRLVLALSKHFEEVVGVDISPAMLDEARKNTQAADISNAHFELSDEALSRVHGQFDLVHSYIVLQHIPVRQGLRLIKRLLAIVIPDGVASLHLTVARTGAPVHEAVYRLRKAIPGVEQLFSLLRTGSTNGPIMQMNAYPLDTVFSIFSRAGYGPVVVDIEPHGNRITLHLAARKRPLA